MSHATFQDHWTSEEDYEMFLALYGHGSHLDQCDQDHFDNFIPPSQGDFTYNLVLIGQAVSEKMFEYKGSPGVKMFSKTYILCQLFICCKFFS